MSNNAKPELISVIEKKCNTQLQQFTPDQSHTLRFTAGYVLDKDQSIIELSLKDICFNDLSFLKDLASLRELTLSNLDGEICIPPELISLASLRLENCKFVNIAMLERLEKLTSLSLERVETGNITKLSQLKSLTCLTLSALDNLDLSFLAGLQNLASLTLFGNASLDFSIIATFYKLKELFVSIDNISNISVLANLKNIEYLYLPHAKLTDISPISELKNLAFLYLSYNEISDISSLSKLVNTCSMSLTHNKLTDISALKDCKNLSHLQLSNNNITDISPLENLNNLKSLYLASTRVADISPLKNLINLASLNLSENIISDFHELLNLKNLTSLELRQFHLAEIPWISEFEKLENLDLSNNHLSDISILASLKELKTLNLAVNSITDISPLLTLKKLTRLDLSINNIAEIPNLPDLKKLTSFNLMNNKIKVLPRWITTLNQEIFFDEALRYEGIHLGGNPLEIPSPSIVKQGTEAIKVFFEGMENETCDYLYEAKLIFVGEERAGKTTLSKALTDPMFDFENTKHHIESTQGIEIGRWSLLPSEFDGKNTFLMNLWDFGGQEIYHSTHQFFLTKHSLYVLIQEARKEMRHDDYYYWLNCIEILGERSPTVIVINKCDQPTDSPPIDEYRERFNFITDYCETSCINNQKATIELLKSKLSKILKNRKYMPHIGTPLPKSWIYVRKKLEDLKLDGMNYLSLRQYHSICDEFKINHIQADYLLGIFHDLGVVLYFGDSLILEKVIFLNYSFVTDAVYMILDNEKVKTNSGVFSLKDIKNIWDTKKYNDKTLELLEIMKHDGFELCYEITNAKNTYMAPQLLPREIPESIKGCESQFESPLCYEFRYKFMPKGILPRLIVRLKKYVDLGRCWRSGMFLDYDNSKAYVRENYFDRKIEILVDGLNKKELLSNIQYNIREINESFRQLSVEEMIPCICEECVTNWSQKGQSPYYFKRSDLDRRRKKKIDTIECNQSYVRINVEELLGSAIIKLEKSSDITHYHIYSGDLIKGDSMKIGKQINKNVENLLNADNITNRYGLDENQIIDAIKELIDDEKELLRTYYNQLEKVRGKNNDIENSITKKIKTFLVNSGISIAQNLTAAGIYDVCKSYFG